MKWIQSMALLSDAAATAAAAALRLPRACRAWGHTAGKNDPTYSQRMAQAADSVAIGMPGPTCRAC